VEDIDVKYYADGEDAYAMRRELKRVERPAIRVRQAVRACECM
jgi:hypothetical protein